MNDALLKYLVTTDEKSIGEVVGSLNRYGAWIEGMNINDNEFEKEIKFKISSSDMKSFETWVMSRKTINVKITRVT